MYEADRKFDDLKKTKSILMLDYLIEFEQVNQF